MPNAAGLRAGVVLSVGALRAGLYGRNSKGLDKSIDAQLVEGRDAAEDNGWPIVAEYSDGVSASRFGRKSRAARSGTSSWTIWTRASWM
jgi:hypothetical protein